MAADPGRAGFILVITGLLPVVPVPVLLAAAAAAAALTWLSSAWPTRQALRRTPIRAYLDAS